MFLLFGIILLISCNILGVAGNNHIDKVSEVDLKKLFKEYKAGEQQAFTILYRECAKELYNYILRRVLDENETADILQECFVTLATNYDSEKSGVKTFLFAVANKKISKSKRAQSYAHNIRQRVNDMSLAREVRTPLENLTAKEWQKYLNEAINSLSPTLREAYKIFEMKEFGCPSSEIAELDNTDSGTFRTQLSRIRQQLWEKLREYMSR